MLSLLDIFTRSTLSAASSQHTFFFLTHYLYLHVTHTQTCTCSNTHTHTGTVLMHDPVSPCVLMECVPPCSDRPGFGEEAPGVPLSSGPSTPLRAQTFSSFSPSKSYSRQSSSSDTELSLTPKTVGIFQCPSTPALDSESSPLPSVHLPCHLRPGMSSRSTTPPPLHISQSDTAMLRKSVSFSEELLLAASGMGSGGSVGKEAGPLKALLRQQTQSALEQRVRKRHIHMHLYIHNQVHAQKWNW